MNNLGYINTIGEAWIKVLKQIKKRGKHFLYNGDINRPIQEIVGISFTIKNIIMPDPIIE